MLMCIQNLVKFCSLVLKILSGNEISIYLSIFLYVLTPEGDIRRVPGNQVLGVSFVVVFFASFCAMLVVLVVSERRASACLIMLSAKQGSHWYHF